MTKNLHAMCISSANTTKEKGLKYMKTSEKNECNRANRVTLNIHIFPILNIQRNY